MKKERVHKLNKKAQEIAEMFSNPDRQFNYNKETFENVKERIKINK